MRGHSSLRFNPYNRRSGGFTLVELVISIVLIGMLAAVGSSMIVDSITTTRMVNADNASAGQARYALERLAREIREVKYASSGAIGSYCITTMTASQIVFIKYVSGTPSDPCGTGGVTVTINYSNPNLTLQYSSPAITATLANQANSFALAYLDILGNPTTDASNNATGIRFVEIGLTVTDPTSGQSISQRTRVALRNG